MYDFISIVNEKKMKEAKKKSVRECIRLTVSMANTVCFGLTMTMAIDRPDEKQSLNAFTLKIENMINIHEHTVQVHTIQYFQHPVFKRFPIHCRSFHNVN